MVEEEVEEETQVEEIQVVRCRRCEKEISIDDLCIKPNGMRGNVCNYCADVLRGTNSANQWDMTKPRRLYCVVCRKYKIWPLEFGPRNTCLVCERKGTSTKPIYVKRRRQVNKWKAANAKKVKETNEKYKERKRQWRLENPEEARKLGAERQRKYRMKKKIAKQIALAEAEMKKLRRRKKAQEPQPVKRKKVP